VIDIGIRREDKNRWERRAPLTPEHVHELVYERGLSVAVQPSPLRIFSDEEYRQGGAALEEDLSNCRVMLGVKEVPPRLLLPAKPYLFFSHVVKGQLSNMPLLRRILELRCTLMDYEMILNRYGKRLIFFGRHAGYAGMVDALWALGQRMLAEGFETSLAVVRPAHTYRSVDEAADFLAATVGRRIRQEGLKPALHPLVVGFTGGGNVSQGAQEILDRLPTVEVHPEDLPSLASASGLSRKAVYKVLFRRDDRIDFARHLPHLTVLLNGIYWQPGQDQLVTRENLQELWSDSARPRLRLLADVSCDVDGSIEATVRVTSPDDPIYVYDPYTGTTTSGVKGRGPVVLAVDNLPAEFPRDASEHFGDSLYPFLTELVAADFTVEFEHLALPAAVLGAVVAHGGELAPRYRHLEESLKKAGV
jgi:alpha-aminoadipic semialdehyde synthase